VSHEVIREIELAGVSGLFRTLQPAAGSDDVTVFRSAFISLPT
jgi:hypothetical protein